MPQASPVKLCAEWGLRTMCLCTISLVTHDLTCPHELAIWHSCETLDFVTLLRRADNSSRAQHVTQRNDNEKLLGGKVRSERHGGIASKALRSCEINSVLAHSPDKTNQRKSAWHNALAEDKGS